MIFCAFLFSPTQNPRNAKCVWNFQLFNLTKGKEWEIGWQSEREWREREEKRTPIVVHKISFLCGFFFISIFSHAPKFEYAIEHTAAMSLSSCCHWFPLQALKYRTNRTQTNWTEETTNNISLKLTRKTFLASFSCRTRLVVVIDVDDDCEWWHECDAGRNQNTCRSVGSVQIASATHMFAWVFA